MILTPNFVFIHQPKTGGTFVTDVLSDLLGPPKHTFDGDTKIAFFNKHGTCREIPETHRELPICASLRNPYERYVSQYMFAWWKQELPPWIEIDAVLAHFPHFPELSFEEFVSGSEILLQFFRNDALAEGRRLGLQSEQFVRFFFRQPEVFSTIDDQYLAERRYVHDMYPVTFLKTNRLNRDLHDFLVGMGFSSDELSFILQAPKIRPPGHPQWDLSRDWSADRSWSDYYTPALRQLVRIRERLLFEIFPEFDL